MKLARRKRERESKRQKEERATEKSREKEFAALCAKAELPHLQWRNNEFEATPPAPSPIVKADITIMHAAHQKLGKRWSGSRIGIFEATNIAAVADTGCQTCTAGPELLKAIRCPEEYLIPCRHRIMGITNTSLGVIGAALVKIVVNGKVTRQMVYISRNITGVFLSKTALSELGLINKNFPKPDPPHEASRALNCEAEDAERCSCPTRIETPDRPVTIPFLPTPENVPQLKKWLMSTFASSAFNTCTYQPLQEMKGPPVRVSFKQGAQPHAVHTPIKVPLHWEKQVQADLERDVRLGIIERVPPGTPTTWCSRMIVTPKKDGTPRRTVDLQKLNAATRRETHHTPSAFDLVSTVPNGKRKTVLDAWNGYHSLRLDPNAKNATTFITKYGRYRYCRAPMGFHASGDAYTRRFDDITASQVRVIRCIDDSLLWDDNIEQSFWHTFDYIKTCADSGIVFNREKFKFAEEIVEFAGFELTQDSYRPPPKILDAIRNFPTPTDISGVRSWFGLVNQVSYAFAQTEAMAPFRELLSCRTTRSWLWDETLSQLFEQPKEEIIRQVCHGVRTFEVGRPTALSTDWSRKGLGFTLTQKHCNCPRPANPICGPGHWKLVYAGSRFTRDPETRYAPIEGEALAAVYGLQSCRTFILGCPELILAVDHKPLVKIFNDRELESISNPRLLQLKQKTLMYTFRIIHIPGKSNDAPDALSRNPVKRPEITAGEEEVSVTAASHEANITHTISTQSVYDEAALDEECTALTEVITNGFPGTRNELPENLRHFWSMRDDLYVDGHLPFRSEKMLIPKRMRPQVLEGLHAAHQGVNSMLANARERFFWPGLDAAIRLYRAQCRTCNERAPSQTAEPMVFTPDPETPFQQVVMDLFSLKGHQFLVYADRLSGWIEIVKPKSTSFGGIKPALLKWFSTFGVPEEISSDGGPPFNGAEFRTFMQEWDIRHRQSSAHYPQSNGRAEVAVKTAKRILSGNTDTASSQLDTEGAARALLTYRNTPCQDSGISPAVALFGYPLRDHLPSQRPLRKEWQQIADARDVALGKRMLRPSVIRQSEGRSLLPLTPGDAVQIQNQHGNYPNRWQNTGVVAESLPNRQYRVITDGSRRVTLRNRKFLKQINPVCRKPATIPDPVIYKEVTPAGPPVYGTAPELINMPRSPAPREVLQEAPVATNPQSSGPARADVPDVATTTRQPRTGAPPTGQQVQVDEPGGGPPPIGQTPRRSSRVTRVPRKLDIYKL